MKDIFHPHKHNTTLYKSENSKELLRDSSDDYFIYNGTRVQVITVLSGPREHIAIVEDENGVQFDVNMDKLR